MKKRGIGIGCMFYGCGNTGLPNPAGAFVDIMDDGTVRVLTGCADIGQGSSTTLAQIAAEEIGVPVSDVAVFAGDTGQSPDAGASSASRQTYISGNAVLKAAREAKANVYAMAADMLGVSAEALTGADGIISVKPQKSDLMNDCQGECQISLGIAPGKEGEKKKATSVTFKDAVAKCRMNGVMSLGSGWFNPPTTGLDPVTGEGTPYGTYAFATQVAEVEVDDETGEIRVLQIVAAHDVGTAINPMHCEGQIEGGSIMGLGYALMEEIVRDKGKVRTDSLNTYTMPTASDVPLIHSIVVEDPEATGPFGAKGLGEPALIPTAAAIANAVYNAVGVRVENLPISPEYLLRKIKEQKEQSK